MPAMNHTIFFFKNVVPKLHVTCLPLQVFCVSLITMKFLSITISKVQYRFFLTFQQTFRNKKKSKKKKSTRFITLNACFFLNPFLTPLSNNQMNWYLYYYNTILGRENILFSLKHFWIDWIPAFHNVLAKLWFLDESFLF